MLQTQMRYRCIMCVLGVSLNFPQIFQHGLQVTGFADLVVYASSGHAAKFCILHATSSYMLLLYDKHFQMCWYGLIGLETELRRPSGHAKHYSVDVSLETAALLLSWLLFGLLLIVSRTFHTTAQ